MKNIKMVWGCNSANTFKITPYAFQKFMFFANNEDEVEVSGFFILDEEDNTVLRDFFLVEQDCGGAHTDMTQEGLSNFLSEMDDCEVAPNLCMRVWGHTHPGFAPNPSGQDNETFAELYAKYPWFTMLIVNPADMSYTCRVGSKAGPGLQQEFNVVVDLSFPMEEIDFNDLQAQYEQLVTVQKSKFIGFKTPSKYEEGYSQINWDDKGFLKKSWERSATGLWEDDYDYELEKTLKKKSGEIFEKSISQMTDEEFEEYEEYVNNLEEEEGA